MVGKMVMLGVRAKLVIFTDSVQKVFPVMWGVIKISWGRKLQTMMVSCMIWAPWEIQQIIMMNFMILLIRTTIAGMGNVLNSFQT